MSENNSIAKVFIRGAALLLVIGIGVVGYYHVRVRPYKLQAESISCQSNLRQIAIGAVCWADEHQGRYPTNFENFRDVGLGPKLFVCPSDASNSMLKTNDWSGFNARYSSYEIVSPGMKDGDRSTLFARCKIHGHASNGDGMVVEGDEHPRFR